jgi:uncharacterized protein YraI
MAITVDLTGKEGYVMANSVNIQGRNNSVEVQPIGNSVKIVEPVGNSVEISLFNVTTAEYFLSAAQTLEEHREAE